MPLTFLLTRFIAKDYPFEARRALAKSADGFSRDHWKQFAELGLLALPFAATQTFNDGFHLQKLGFGILLIFTRGDTGYRPVQTMAQAGLKVTHFRVGRHLGFKHDEPTRVVVNLCQRLVDAALVVVAVVVPTLGLEGLQEVVHVGGSFGGCIADLGSVGGHAGLLP